MATDLRKIKGKLRSGDRMKIAVRMGVDPSKITKAFYGLVKDENFLVRLAATANEILKESQAVPIE